MVLAAAGLLALTAAVDATDVSRGLGNRESPACAVRLAAPGWNGGSSGLLAVIRLGGTAPTAVPVTQELSLQVPVGCGLGDLTVFGLASIGGVNSRTPLFATSFEVRPGSVQTLLIPTETFTAIDVEVRDEDGNAQPGGIVQFRGLIAGDQVSTFGHAGCDLSADGRCSLVLTRGSYRLGLSTPGGATVVTVNSTPVSEGPVVQAQGSTTQVAIVVKRRDLLQGRVIAPGGRGLGGIILDLASRERDYAGAATTSESGDFTVAVEGWPVDLRARDPRGEWRFDTQRTVSSPGDATVIVAQPTPTASVQVRVRTSMRSVPQSPYTVGSQWDCGGAERGGVLSVTDVSGAARVRCSTTCRTRIELQPPGRGVDGRELEAIECDDEHVVELEVRAPPRVRIRVHPERTALLRKRETVVRAVSDSGTTRSARTSSDGTAQFLDFEPGNYRLESSVKGILLLDREGNRATIQIPATGTGDDVEKDVWEVRGGRACIRLRGEDGVLRAAVQLTAIAEDTGDTLAWTPLPLQADEVECSPALVPGSYRIRSLASWAEGLWSWWPGTFVERNAGVITVSEGLDSVVPPAALPGEGVLRWRCAGELTSDESLALVAAGPFPSRNDAESNTETRRWEAMEDAPGRFAGSWRDVVMATGWWRVRLCRRGSRGGESLDCHAVGVHEVNAGRVHSFRFECSSTDRVPWNEGDSPEGGH